MKKLFYFFITLLPLLTSCELETSDNGDFDGFWHLVSVDTLANAQHQDLSQKRIFWEEGMVANIMNSSNWSRTS